jgi:hypothetical protein
MKPATETQTQELIDELTEIQAEILDALLRAKSYWLAHAKMAITRQHEYLGGSMVTMEDTIEEIRNAEDDEG